MTTEVQPRLSKISTGDEDRFAHIVKKDDQMRGYIEGQEITALCGYKWVPSRDPEKLPICPQCLMTHQHLRGGDWN